MAETHFDEWAARNYRRLWPELFEPAALDPCVDLIAELAGTGRALEFGVGTGRVALPLANRGVHVQGIEFSAAMVAQLKRDGGDAVDTTVGSFANTLVDGQFSLVYLLRNTITNLTTQTEQVEAFQNAARHLEPGGRFVIENYIPALQRLPPGETTRIFASTPDHVGYEEYDVAAQIAVSHHHWVIDGQLRSFTSPHRYLWPAELDLMAHIAGMTLLDRWSDWHRGPFTGLSQSHTSVWQKSL